MRVRIGVAVEEFYVLFILEALTGSLTRMLFVLAQYPLENEVVFPPLSNIEVIGDARVEVLHAHTQCLMPPS